ncbi:hypothetical protein CRM22_006300 [Opisthorchis felineus]|uniref:Glycosyltransferase 2-like domain-containing protein n=2 Tax=Opisthorchis felineus TaxID=147828 RepID=A0A4S2LLX8_OPIFE|nr:hypothetical protein CRM22_006300 [Opisthorchis felineus]
MKKHCILLLCLGLLLVRSRPTSTLLFQQDLVQNKSDSPCHSCECWTGNQLLYHSSERKSWEWINSHLAKVSIIITSFNEEPDLLRKTLNSIWMNTSMNLIHEVILVDDCSSRTDLFSVIPKYPLVRLMRNPTRLGLIRSRMVGARAATAEILVFLDSHVETTSHWLEPLLARLLNAKNHTGNDCIAGQPMELQVDCIQSVAERLVVSPIIYDISNPNELDDRPVWGGFTWNLTFRWEYMKAANRLDHILQPWASPAISGGIYATWRKGFFDLGGYDEEMDIWGGENVELSLRTWLCLGRMEIVPCSRVGHYYRSVHPYNFPQGKEYTVVRNRKRTALVWFVHGESQDRGQYYLQNFYKNSPTAISINAGGLSERKKIAQDLNCKSFTWYLDKIYPSLRDETDIFYLWSDR